MNEKLDVRLQCPSLSTDLFVTTADIHEALSVPTRALVVGVSVEDIDGDEAIGKDAKLEILVDGSPVRVFHLVVVGFQFDGIHGGNKRRYIVDLAHELSLLSLRSDVRMFQEKNAREILAEVLEAGGVPGDHVSYALRRTPGKRTYCIQYRETDFAFASRLLEYEGIFYVITHSDGNALVTFADSSSVFEPLPGESAFRMLDDDMHGVGIHDFVLETTVTPEKVTLSDYNLETPSADLKAEKSVAGPFTGDWFEYPSGHQTPAEGQTIAAIRMEELRAAGEVGSGRSDLPSFCPGALFDLEEASQEALNQKYVLRSVDHHVVVRANDSASTEHGYSNRFTCVPVSAPFRPPREAPRARLRGVHSAVVTGPSGSEIHTERLGRMKGKFFWDRVGKDDDTSSCWMRVAQFPVDGSMALARVGWEMGVAYFDGDPDRPLALMRLYNAEKTSPYSYPAAKSQMALQTPSSPGGGKSNEIRMQDGGGGQEFFVNASKDYLGETGNNKSETIGVNEKRDIGVHSEWTVVSNQKVSVGANESMTVSGEATLTVKANRTKSVGASETVTVSSDVGTIVTGSDTEVTGGSHTTLAALGVTRTSSGSQSLTVAGSMIHAAAAGVGVVVAGARSETIGAAKIAVSGGPVGESIFGALVNTVGGVCVNAAGGNRIATTKGVAALTVGGIICANAGGQATIKAKTISIKVLGVANFLGGGGVVTLTPGSASFAGIIGLDASGSIKISGNPNLVG
jgi:type VI secretion system secreted protein VgrG